MIGSLQPLQLPFYPLLKLSFLSHLKDDVIIVNRENFKAKNGSKLNQIKVLERLSKLDRLMAQSNNKVMVTREIATNTDGMIDDIS